jgi:hypothetical protein
MSHKYPKYPAAQVINANANDVMEAQPNTNNTKTKTNNTSNTSVM